MDIQSPNQAHDPSRALAAMRLYVLGQSCAVMRKEALETLETLETARRHRAPRAAHARGETKRGMRSENRKNRTAARFRCWARVSSPDGRRGSRCR